MLGEAWNELTHYVTDYDLRNKDSEYEKHMRKRLLKYIEEIRKKYLFS
jgi:hypothetical protein